tara:strand:- start:296 stop:1522 length:1227 start_codon:yes stop_codon:yes gene_type:complete
MALKGNQKKLDKNNNNKIDAQDFKILKAEKAKGRGMGLQDEKVKPGKVIKAKRGTGVLSEKGTSKNFRGYSKVFEGPQNKGKVATISGVKPNPKKPRKTYKSMEEMRQAKGFKPGESAKDFNKRQMLKREALKAAKATRLGKIVLPVVGAAIAAKTYLNSKMKKDNNKKTLKDFREQKKPGVPSEKTKTINSALNKLNKKMGGGMMNRPMGYKKGKEIDYGKIFDKKFYKTAQGKEAQLHADDYDAGLDRAERRAASETMALMKKNKKMGGGMMKRYSEGGDAKKSPVAGMGRRAGQRKPKPGPSARAGRRAGLGALGGSGNVKPKMKVVIIGGSENSLTGQGGLERDVNNKPYRYSYSTDPMLKGATIIKSSSRMGGGMMNKPMGYKSGKSIKVKCKLGRNKPTKMY